MIMKRIQKIVLVSLCIFAIASCVKPEISVNADFTTNKDVYELYEDVIITNTSTATNDIIVACKWDWGTGYVWGKQLEKPLSFETVGEKEITLTAVTHNNVSGTVTKKITVQDTNKHPVADFVWSPETGIVAGDEVQFTDKSSDADGSIVAWEWKIGGNIVTEQNPKYVFNEFGDIDVTLTVTDNQRGKGFITKTVHVERNNDSMELLWGKKYESDAAARAIFSSPAVSPDGNTIYAFSSGWHLVAFGKDGTQKWSFDAGIHNPATTSNASSCTPSVDEDGTIFVIVGNKDAQDKTGATESGIYAVKPDGTQKWYYPYAYAMFWNPIPMVLSNQIFIATKRNPSVGDFPALWPDGAADNGLLINKADGKYFNYLLVKRGSHGGYAATKDDNFMVHTDSKYGTRVFWKENGNWKKYGANAGQDAFMLGYIPGKTNTEIGFTSYMAIDSNDKVYILYGKADGSSSSSSSAILYCYDLKKYDKSAGASPEWTLELAGENKMYYSLGTVIGGDGTIYVTTTAGVSAVTPQGSLKWFTPTGGNEAIGCPAVDNQGYIYYSESDANETVGKLVKLKSDGTKASEITLGLSLRSSPTIGPDGTIYCTGLDKDGGLSLFAVKGTATGPAAGWSQLGGNPRKTCKAE